MLIDNFDENHYSSDQIFSKWFHFQMFKQQQMSKINHISKIVQE